MLVNIDVNYLFGYTFAYFEKVNRKSELITRYTM